MHFAKFANPHLTPTCFADTIQVDRAQLFGDSTLSESTDSLKEERELLDEIICSALEVPEVRAGSSSSPRISKKQKRKATKADDPYEKEHLFRLFEGSPKPIVLSIKPHEGHVLERPSEDTEEEAQIRSARAQEVAVEFDWLQNQALIPWAIKTVPPPRTLYIDSSISDSLTNPPTITLLEHDLPPKAPPFITSAKTELLGSAKQISQPNVYCTKLLVTERSQTNTSPGSRRPSPRDRLHNERPNSTFFQPDAFLGGKSRGYALGYPRICHKTSKSNPGVPNIHYRRDRMRKAAYSEDGDLQESVERHSAQTPSMKRSQSTR